MAKHANNKSSNKESKNDKTGKKDMSNQKPRMKKPGDKGFKPQQDYIGDGSAGMGGTSAI